MDSHNPTPEEIEMLRALYRQGSQTTDIIAFVLRQSPDNGPGGVQVAFMYTFCLTFSQARWASWSDDGTFERTAEKVNQELVRHIEVARSRWDVGTQ